MTTASMQLESLLGKSGAETSSSVPAAERTPNSTTFDGLKFKGGISQ
jgi:hypothetical protein